MVLHHARFAPVKVSVTATVSAKFNPPSLPEEEILTRLVPIRSQIVQVDDFRFRQGWPVAVPKIDVRCQPLVSVSGLGLAQRPEPADVATRADVRWCGYPETFDTVANVWRPISGVHMHYRWLTSDEYSPSYLPDFSYIIGKELFRRQAINFDATTFQHMWGDFAGGLTNTLGYTVIMVVWLNSALGNTEDRIFSGLWGPGAPTPALQDLVIEGEQTYTFDEDEAGFALMLDRTAGLVIDTEFEQGSQGLNIDQLITSARPVYVAAAFGRPTSTVWASMGPGKTRQFTFNTGDEALAQDFDMVLGRSKGSLVNTADMALFDIGLYGDLLSAADVEEEISILSQSYGG